MILSKEGTLTYIFQETTLMLFVESMIIGQNGLRSLLQLDGAILNQVCSSEDSNQMISEYVLEEEFTGLVYRLYVEGKKRKIRAVIYILNGSQVMLYIYVCMCVYEMCICVHMCIAGTESDLITKYLKIAQLQYDTQK